MIASSTLRAVMRGLVALLGLAALVLGVPAVLWAAGGSPLPAELPSWAGLRAVAVRPDDGSLFLALLIAAGWLGWGTFVVSLLVEVPAALCGRPARRLPGLGAQQRVVAGLIAAVAAIGAAGPAVSAEAPSGPWEPAPPVTTDQLEAQRGGTHVVVPGDTLWEIADARLDDPLRYPEIVAASSRTVQADGRRLTDPDLIVPGWTLTLPDTAGRPDTGGLPDTGGPPYAGGTRPGAAATEPEGGVASTARVRASRELSAAGVPGVSADLGPGGAGDHPAGPERGGSAGVIAIVAPVGSGGASGDVSAGGDVGGAERGGSAGVGAIVAPVGSGGASGDVSAGGDVGGAERGGSSGVAEIVAQAGTDAGGPGGNAPALADVGIVGRSESEPADDGELLRTVGGVGAVLAASLVGVLATQRAREQRRRRPGTRLGVGSETDRRAETELRQAADPDAVELVDRVLRGLAAQLARAGRGLPPLRAVRLTRRTLELYLAAPAELPAPFAGTAHGGVWTVPLDAALDDGVGVPAPYPSLVTLGHDNDDALVLLDLEQVGTLVVDGPPELVRSALTAVAAELATSVWADDLRVTLIGAPALADLDLLDTGRVRHVTDVERLLDELTVRVADDRLLLATAGVSGLGAARVTQVADAAWTPEIVVIAEPLPAGQWDRLEALIVTAPRVAVAAVVGSGEPNGLPSRGQRLRGWSPHSGGGTWVLRLDGSAERPMAILDPLGVPVRPQLLDEETRGRILRLLRAAVGSEYAEAEAVGSDEREGERSAGGAGDDPARGGRGPANGQPAGQGPADHGPGDQGPAWRRVVDRDRVVGDCPGAGSRGATRRAAERARAGATPGRPVVAKAAGAVGGAAAVAAEGATGAVRATAPEGGTGAVRATGAARPTGAVRATAPEGGTGAARPTGAVSAAGVKATGVAQAVVGPGAAVAGDIGGTGTSGAAGVAVRGSDQQPPRLLMLGAIEVQNAAELGEQSKLGQLTELAMFIALNPGCDSAAIDEAIWPGSAVTKTTRGTAISKLRRWLGTDPQGASLLPRTDSGYTLRPLVRSDWDDWRDLLPDGPARASIGELRAAIELVRGRPFSGRGRRRYTWADHLAQEMIASIVDVCHELALRSLVDHDPWEALRAALLGLTVEPAVELLWRDRLKAEAELGDREALLDSIGKLRSLAAELGGDLEAETEELIERIVSASGPAAANGRARSAAANGRARSAAGR